MISKQSSKIHTRILYICSTTSYKVICKSQILPYESSWALLAIWFCLWEGTLLSVFWTKLYSNSFYFTWDMLAEIVIFQTPKHVWNMFDFNTTSNLHSHLVLFVPKTPLVVWYFITDLIPPKVHGYFTLFESKSTVIFIFVCCLIISFKLHKFTWTLCGVFPSPNLNSYIVFH